MNNEKNTNTPAENEELKEAQEIEEVQEVEADDQEESNVEKAEEPVKEKEKSGKQKNKKSFHEYLKSPKFKHGGIATAFTAGFIAIVILINVLVSILTTRFPSMNIDMTNSGTNTLSAQAIKVAQAVKYNTNLYIIGAEQLIKNDSNYSQVASLAAKLAEKNTKIKVSYVDIDKDPTFATKNSISETLAAGDVVLKTEKRYRVLAQTDLFSQQQDSTTGQTVSYSLVDGALASAVNQVNSETLPVAAFETGHSALLDVTGLKTLLSNNSFEAKDFNSLTDAVPENAQLLVIPTPSTDYTDAELTKLDTFLSNTKVAGSRSLVITFDPSQKAMPKLANFLKEWGLAVKTTSFIAETDSTKAVQYANCILNQIGTKLPLGGQSDYGYVVMPQTCPIDLLFATQGNVTTYSLATSYETSYLTDGKTTDTSAKKASYNTAALAQKSITVSDKSYKANVVVLGSSAWLNANLLSATAYGNSKYAIDLLRYATGTSNNDTGVTINQVQTNVTDITINSSVASALGIGVFTLLIPIGVLIAGIFVYLRRRHL